MSNTQKKGMQFFKKFSGEAKQSILSGMKIKTNKEQKTTSQTQTNFSFIQKKPEDLKPPTAVDDSDMKRKEPPAEVRSKQGRSFKNNAVKSSESTEKVEKGPVLPKVVQESENRLPALETKPKSQEGIPLTSVAAEKLSSEEDSRSIKISKGGERSVSGGEKEASPLLKKPQPSEKTIEASLSDKRKSEKPVVSKQPAARKSSVPRQPERPVVKKSQREQLLSQIGDYTVRLVSLVLRQRDLKLQVVRSREGVEEWREKLVGWVGAQAVCAKREEYEEADRLQGQIEQAQKKVLDLEADCQSLEQQVLKHQRDEVQLLRARQAGLRRVSRRVKLVELQLQDEAANIKREEMERVEQLRARQEAEKKKALRIERDIAFQSEQIEKFEKEFREELDGKLQPLEQERVCLESQRVDLQGEVRELEKRLKERRASLQKVVGTLSHVAETIDQVRNSFKRDSERLQQRKNSLQIVEDECEEMQQTIRQLEGAIAAEISSMDARVSVKTREAEELAEVGRGIEEGQAGCEEELERRRAGLDSYLSCVSSLRDFEDRHRTERERLREIQYRKSVVASEIGRLQERREQLRRKLPGLEQEQKKFADQKNFKAAGVKKGEVKDINEELANIKERLDDYLSEEHGMEMELEAVSAAQKEANEEEATLRRNLALSQVRFNAEKVNKMEEYREQIKRGWGLQVTERDRLLNGLDREIERLRDESKYLTSHFQLDQRGDKKEQEHEEEHELQQPHPDDLEGVEGEEGEENYLEEGMGGGDHPEEQEEHKYVPLVLDNQELEPHQETEGGYVPLQLD